ncbi:MAG: zinc-binding alcohol dehydrogenase family protein [Amycolatopsis sp.]|uniref:quinone oxidoreductase family protein n=1 Tax=Amycolatopsis sp. TaxID=37632 RepID=UPI0026291E41|nr:zinc-binding alcohol dehydrogenase family protein [Amycolatopsis sp.]MCU1687888.1 zinc-binding alcohol dehydrogenase family protein [Amycolatopsis sp.]
MRALRFDRFGGPDVLRVAELPDPVATDGTAVVAVRAASVNPSDLKNVAGVMEGTVLPRVPGRDFAGIVVAGPADWLGAEVWGTGGDVGFTFDGSHAEFLRVPVGALARKPERLSFEEASAVGVNFVIGWLGAVEIAQLQKGETVVVFGISGGVGGAVAQIAHARGARVLGVGRVAPADGTPAAEIVDEFVPFTGDSADVVDALLKHTGGRGAEVVYDAVGGVTTAAALAVLAQRGRLVVISAVGTPMVEIHLPDFYHREARLLGADSRQLDVTESAERLTLLTPFFERGEFRPLPVAHRFGLDDGPQAYAAVADRVPGRVVILPERLN